MLGHESKSVSAKVPLWGEGYKMWFFTTRTKDGSSKQRGLAEPALSAPWALTRVHSYDQQGHRVQTDTENDGDEQVDSVMRFQYDGDLLVAKLWDTDADGIVDAQTFYEYGPAGRPVRATVDQDGDGRPDGSWTYTFELDEQGRVAMERRTDEEEGHTLYEHVWEYDDDHVTWEEVYRLVGGLRPVTTTSSHQLDGFGNRLSTQETERTEYQGVPNGSHEQTEREYLYSYDCFRGE